MGWQNDLLSIVVYGVNHFNRDSGLGDLVSPGGDSWVIGFHDFSLGAVREAMLAVDGALVVRFLRTFRDGGSPGGAAVAGRLGFGMVLVGIGSSWGGQFRAV